MSSARWIIEKRENKNPGQVFNEYRYMKRVIMCRMTSSKIQMVQTAGWVAVCEQVTAGFHSQCFLTTNTPLTNYVGWLNQFPHFEIKCLFVFLPIPLSKYYGGSL